MESSSVRKPSTVTFSTSLSVMVERTQEVAEDLAMALLVIRCFRRIHTKLRSGAGQERSRREESSNGGGGGNKTGKQ
jgi:hypothetical protein